MASDPIKLLTCRVVGVGQVQVAKDLGVSVSYLNDVLNGRRAPGPKILKALGLERKIVYSRAVASESTSA